MKSALPLFLHPTLPAIFGLPIAVITSVLADPGDLQRPNFIVIVADDLGYGDVGFNGGQEARTPNLDRLAGKGLVFTDFHSNCSVCSPTRAALLTGRYQHRTGVVNVLGQTGEAFRKIRPEDPFVGLELEEVTVAEQLKNAGYATGAFGKWHLGPLETHGPNAQGFDVFVGVDGLPYNDFTYVYRGRNRLYRGDREPAPNESGQYFTYKLADEVGKFVRENQARPFFAYVPLTAPHVPLWGPNDRDLTWDEKDKYGPRPDTNQAYIEVVEAMDKAVGQIVADVAKLGLEGRTLVIFTSDNGPIEFGSAEPFTGRKSNLYEGGTRVPTLFFWPGVVQPGRTEQLAMTMDLAPTLLSLAGIKPDADYPLDGVDLSGVLLSGEALAERMVFWEKPHGVFMNQFDKRRFAVRDGKWKLLDDGHALQKALFDLETDPREQKDVSAANPERVQRMYQAFEAWKKEVYSDAPYNLEEVIGELKDHGIITSSAIPDKRTRTE